MSVFNALNTALYNKLAGGTALTTLLGGTAIYYQQAPDHTNLPYVIWSYAGGGDENMTPGRMKNNIIYARGYAANAALAGSIDAQVDALLHDGSLSVSGWSNFWLARETDLETQDTMDSGDKVFMSGGFYRVRLSQQ
jgi:hypothetical protein